LIRALFMIFAPVVVSQDGPKMPRERKATTLEKIRKEARKADSASPESKLPDQEVVHAFVSKSRLLAQERRRRTKKRSYPP
jgi:hypothetical protein